MPHFVCDPGIRLSVASITVGSQEGPGEAGDSPRKAWGSWGLPQEGCEGAGDSPKKAWGSQKVEVEGSVIPRHHPRVASCVTGREAWHIVPMSSSPGIGHWCLGASLLKR